MACFIAELRTNKSIAQRVDSEGNIYRIRVLSKGENLFFQENDRCLLCLIDAQNGIIYSKSIKKWEPNERMSPNERKRVTSLVEKYYREVYNPDVKLS